MATHVPCKKNDTNGYVFYVSLVSQANTKVFQANPTYAAGDIKVAVDDAGPANVSAVAVDADFTKRVKITLSQAQTNGDVLTVICSDAAGDEWCDLTIDIHTSAQTLDEIDVNVDDIETDTNAIETLVKAAGDGDLAAILGDTNAIQGKLPTNKFMGSSDGADDDGTLNSITAAGPTKAQMDTAHALLATPAQVATELGTYDAPTKAELDTAIALVTDDLDNVTDGLGALKALLDTISGYTDLIDDATNGLAAIKAEVEGLGGAAMVGTNGAALASSWTSALATILANFSATRIGYLDELDFGLTEAIAALPTAVEIQTEMEENGASVLDTVRDELANATDGLSALKALLDTAQGVLDKLDSAMEADAAVYRFTENALEEGPSGGAIPTAEEIADQVWDELETDHQTDDTMGAAMSDATEITLEED